MPRSPPAAGAGGVPPGAAAATAAAPKATSTLSPGSDPSGRHPRLEVRTPFRRLISFGPSGATGSVSVKPPFPSLAIFWGRSLAIVPSTEKKWMPSGAGARGLPDLSTLSTASLGPRVAETSQAGSDVGSSDRTERILAPKTGSGIGASTFTGRVSVSLALPGTHSSWHMSQLAETGSSTVVPGARFAGGVSFTGSSRSPS